MQSPARITRKYFILQRMLQNNTTFGIIKYLKLHTNTTKCFILFKFIF